MSAFRLSSLAAVAFALTFALVIPNAGGVADYRRAAYDYTFAEVIAASRTDLERALAPYRKSGRLNRNTREFARLEALNSALVEAATRDARWARTLDWRIYLHDGRMAEAYSRAGGQIVLSAGFFDRYHPDEAQLAFIIGHEIAHVLCQHERIRLSAVWRRNAPQQLLAQYAIEYLDTEPAVRAQIAPIAGVQERVADRIGIELAAAVGVDPLEALRFFDTSAERDDGGITPDVHDTPAQRKALLLRVVAARDVAASERGSHALDCAP